METAITAQYIEVERLKAEAAARDTTIEQLKGIFFNMNTNNSQICMYIKISVIVCFGDQ